ncbi:MAG: PKD domain-containing protein [Woeseia sp.]
MCNSERTKSILLHALAVLFILTSGSSLSSLAVAEDVQRALISEDFGYLNLSERGGPPTGDRVDNDGPPPLQPAEMTAVFSNFELNGIPFGTWSACRAGGGSVDSCLQDLLDPEATGGLRTLHPGAIGGDLLSFDVTITNTSQDAVLTSFSFQSKFSESPALGSRIGDKLFSAERIGEIVTDAAVPANALIGVKKNGTSNGLFGGKVKLMCINSSDDYPSDLNLGTENETLECSGGRTFDRDNNVPVLQAADGSIIDEGNVALPKGLLPGESMTMRLLLDAGTDDGALQRAHGLAGPDGLIGPLTGLLENTGEPRDPDKAVECLELTPGSGNVLDIVNFGDVKIVRDSAGNCAPSFDPFEENQFLTIPRRSWGFTDILDTRDDYLPEELPTVLTGNTGKFSMLDMDDLRVGELNLFEILRGFGEFGETLDPSCFEGGSRAGSCGGAAYVPVAEFYAIADGRLVRQEIAGSYLPSEYGPDGPSLTADINSSACGACKTEDPFEIPGEPNAGPTIGATATATFSDVVVIADDKETIANEAGQAGGNLVRFTVTIENTSPAGSDIYLTSFNFQTKQRGLTDINDALDGTSIQGRQDLRTGADGTLAICGSDSGETRCFDEALGIGRFPNVIGNSLLAATALSGLETGKLEAIKKNGPYQPLTDGFANFICLKSGAPAEDQDADETCSGIPSDGDTLLGLAPGESQSVRLELDYGDFRGLILRVEPGTLVDNQALPFGLIPLRGDFDCRDQRRLPYCHPTLVGEDWFTSPASLEEVEFVTVHQPGDAPIVMNFEQNLGYILAMGGFVPTAEFWRSGSTQVQVGGQYELLPGDGGLDPAPDPEPEPDPDPAPGNELPVAHIAPPACEGLTCTFDGSGSTDSDGHITSYEWQFLDGDSEVGEASGAIVEFTFLSGGTYIASVLVTDDAGGTATAETDVTVEAPPPTDDLTLTVTAFKERGLQKAQLTWSGTSGDVVQVSRSGTGGSTEFSTANDGHHIDHINGRGRGNYTYRICDAGGACTNEAQAIFD